MVDVISIVIAVIALAGTLLAACITAWFGFFTEERRRRREAEEVLAKYRDPLFLAAQDLQSRFFNIVDKELLRWFGRDQARNDNLIQYTCFLVGQYLSWTYILRRKAQFIRMPTDKASRELFRTMDLIKDAFGSTNHGGPLGRPFLLWRGQQMAISEVMTVKEGGELYCMGYAEFHSKWVEDDVFKAWFQTLEAGIEVMAAARSEAAPVPDHRLRHLQHLLIQLLRILDPQKLRLDKQHNQFCGGAMECTCSKKGCAGTPQLNIPVERNSRTPRLNIPVERYYV